MNPKSKIIFALSAFSILAIFYACKKQGQDSSVVSIEVSKSIVQNWQQQFIKTALTRDLKKADSIIANLDLNSAAKVSLSDTITLFFIKINEQTVSANTRFLAISVNNNNNYELDGIYQASSISGIKNFFETKKLPPKGLILVYGIDNHPIKGWEATATGKMLYKKGKSTPRGVAITNLTASVDKKPSSAPAPPQDPCLDWFWVTLDPETDEPISAQYLYSTGNCDGISGGTGGGGGDETENQCNYTFEEAGDMINEVTVTVSDAPSVAVNNGSSSTDASTGKIRQPIVVQKEVLKMTFFLAPNVVTWDVYYVGIKYKNNSSDNIWKWQECTYSSFGQATGELPPCYDATVNVSASPAVISDDQTYATFAFVATGSYKITCTPGSWQQKTIHNSSQSMILSCSN